MNQPQRAPNITSTPAKSGFNVRRLANWLENHLAPISAETLGWLAVVLIHSATIPTLLAMLAGLTDRTPTVDMVLLIWAGLGALFCQAIVQRNTLITITVAVGFMLQAVIMGLIFFK